MFKFEGKSSEALYLLILFKRGAFESSHACSVSYVNSKKQDDTELGRLMHDLHCKNAEDMHSKILADRVYELKETQKRQSHPA